MIGCVSCGAGRGCGCGFEVGSACESRCARNRALRVDGLALGLALGLVRGVVRRLGCGPDRARARRTCWMREARSELGREGRSVRGVSARQRRAVVEAANEAMADVGSWVWV